MPGVEHLVVGVDGVALLVPPLMAPLGALTVLAAMAARTASICRAQTRQPLRGSMRMRIAGFLLPGDVDQAHPVDARNLLREDHCRRSRPPWSIGRVSEFSDRIMIGESAGLTFLIARRGRQVGRQLRAGGVDGRLHVLGGGVDACATARTAR